MVEHSSIRVEGLGSIPRWHILDNIKGGGIMTMKCSYEKCPVADKVINVNEGYTSIPSKNPEIPDAYFHTECYDSALREESSKLMLQTYD